MIYGSQIDGFMKITHSQGDSRVCSLDITTIMMICLDIKSKFMDTQNQPAVCGKVPGAVSGKSVFAFLALREKHLSFCKRRLHFPKPHKHYTVQKILN